MTENGTCTDENDRTMVVRFDVPDRFDQYPNELVEAVLEQDLHAFLPGDFARNVRSVDTDE